MQELILGRKDDCKSPLLTTFLNPFYSNVRMYDLNKHSLRQYFTEYVKAAWA